jgi:hypothetical protein
MCLAGLVLPTRTGWGMATRVGARHAVPTAEVRLDMSQQVV